MSDEQYETAARLLEQHPDYRVVRRFVPVDDFGVPAEGPVARGLVVDTETTGLDPTVDQIIELGAVLFEYSPATGVVHRVVDVYNGLEDPGRPIPAESTAIHGITDAMVKGQRIDEARVARLLEGVSLVIAHNARFDRPLVEKRLPVFASLPWGCSFVQVPWDEEGFAGAKLEYLGWQYGFFFEAHRTEIDCRAVLEVLRRPLPRSGQTALKVLLDRAVEADLRLWATDSPFETKDILRGRGYRWDPEKRCWHRIVTRAEAKDEAAWLKQEVYGGRACRIDVEILDAKVRFSGRSGVKRVKEL